MATIEERLSSVDPELLRGRERADMALVAAATEWVRACGGCSCQSCTELMAATQGVVMVSAAVLSAAGVSIEEMAPLAAEAWSEQQAWGRGEETEP